MQPRSGFVWCMTIVATLVCGSAESNAALSQAKDGQVCGRVMSVKCEKKKDLRRTVLDLKPKSNRGPLIIPPTDRPNFRPSPEEMLLGAEICVAGRIEGQRDRRQMIVSTPGEITILKPATRPPQSWTMEAFRECDDGVEMPVLAHEVRPSYTRGAIRALVRGVVKLEAIVLPDGTVGEVHITRSLDAEYGLDAQAGAAVKRWRFRPGTRFGEAVPVIVQVELSFRLG